MPSSAVSARFFAERLTRWYADIARPLPWRATRDPYAIWISEVILQQTRVAQGLDYYTRFLQRFPTLEALAAADEGQVLKAWEGLGYYSRARNLHRTAQQLVSEHGGQFPQTVEGLLALRGIGPYTARAIASLAFGVEVAVVDGNVFRVLSRVYDDATAIDGSQARAHYQPLADRLLAPPAATFNQALMELGALICTPRAPSCGECPVRELCQAYAHRSVKQRPVKGKRTERPLRRFEATLVYDAQGRLCVRRRPSEGKGVWRGLYELPTTEVRRFAKLAPTRHERLRLTHEFSHYRMELRVVEIPLDELTPDQAHQWVTPDEREALAFGKAYLKVFAALAEPSLFTGGR